MSSKLRVGQSSGGGSLFTVVHSCTVCMPLPGVEGMLKTAARAQRFSRCTNILRVDSGPKEHLLDIFKAVDVFCRISQRAGLRRNIRTSVCGGIGKVARLAGGR
jgi:alcohol dehydrogenase class IV